MKLKYLGFLLLVALLGLVAPGCFEGKDDLSKQGVCIYNGDTSVRATPSVKGEWLSSLSLGETVKLESGLIKDANDPKNEYIKVKLSDGTKGYASAWCIVTSAYPGVIQRSTKIYKRPDFLAESNQKFDIMNIVAVQEEKGDWLRVTGEGRAKMGWIEKDSVRKDKEDVVTAVLLRKAIRGKENSLNRAQMEEIVSKLPYPNNYFIDKVMEKYESDNTADLVEQPVSSESLEVNDNESGQ